MDLHNREPEPMETKDYENNMDEAEGQRQRNALQNNAMDLHNREPEPMETNGYENNMDEAKGQRKHKKSKDKDFWKQTIRASGKTFLKVFQRLLNETQADIEKKFKYMQKVYHAIFFYGHINDPQVAPKEFIPERAWDSLQKTFPKPLAEYNTRLPSQTPYSILLEYITNYYRGDKELILNELEKRNKEFFNHFYDDENNKFKLSEFALSAAVISHSCADDANAFGSLIAYKGSVPTRIMIAISCLLVWDKVISYEVRCEKGGHGIQFPKKVCCSAYKFEMNNHKYKETPPCVHCNKMFIVTFNPKCTETEEKADWPYGNCAETESLSNLLRDNEKIRNVVHTYDEDNRRTIVDRATIISRFTKLECKLKKDVKQLLESRKFRVTQNNFVLFTPAALAHR